MNQNWILQNINTGIIITNSIHEIEFINAACNSILNIEDCESLLGSPLSHAIDNLFQHCSQEKRAKLQYKLSTITDSNLSGIFALDTEKSYITIRYQCLVSENKHILEISASEKLAQHPTENSDLIKKIIDNLPIDLVVFDMEHRYLYVNKSAIQNDEYRNWIIGKDDFEYCVYRNVSSDRAISRREMFHRIVREKNL